MGDYAVIFFPLFAYGGAEAGYWIAINRGWKKELLFPIYEWVALLGAALGIAVYALTFLYLDHL